MLAVAAAMWLATYWLKTVDVLGILRWPMIAVFLALGLLAPIAARQFTRAKTSVNPLNISKASSLLTTGVFAWSRNPMYLAMACILIAWALFLSVAWTLLGPVLFVAFITRFQIVPEERVLADKFGAEYAAYRERVRRWI
jgi:protein-S-isoprenylcysteine O-methyltransferase Ste14